MGKNILTSPAMDIAKEKEKEEIKSVSDEEVLEDFLNFLDSLNEK